MCTSTWTVRLRDKRKPRSVWRAKLAGAYPPPLARAWSKAVAAAAPARARCGGGEDAVAVGFSRWDLEL
eukprot:3244930-Lingulodinium_polyedra.AAC.1